MPSTGKVETNDVTDPYSAALTTNSGWSIAADLGAPGLGAGRLGPVAQAGARPAGDSTIYELHIRDFSIGDGTVPEGERGTYLAFTHPETAGMTH